MKRIVLNIAILVIFLTVMNFHALPKLLHEVLGLIFFVSVFIHLFLNKRWFSTLRLGNYNTIRFVSSLVNLLLIICFIIVTITGICMSNHLFKDLIPIALQRNITLYQLHVSLPFLMLILTGLHLGFHWQDFKARLVQFFRWRVSSAIYRCITAVLVCIGIYGSFLNQVGDRLLIKHIFATPATNLHGILYALLLLSIIVLYVFLGNKIRGILERYNK